MTHPLQTLEIRTGSRLHFGLTSIGASNQSCFGGLGVMIEQPETRLVIKPAQRFVAHEILSAMVFSYCFGDGILFVSLLAPIGALIRNQS